MRKKGVTLLELLWVIFLLSLGFSTLMPAWWEQKNLLALQQEKQGLYTFLRLIQTRAQASQDYWLLLINQRGANWCLSAQKKDDLLCDCFAPQHCPRHLHARFYYPQANSPVVLTSNFLYPQIFLRLNNTHKTQQSRCFALSYQQQRWIFVFSNLKLRIEKGALGGLSRCNRELAEDE